VVGEWVMEWKCDKRTGDAAVEYSWLSLLRSRELPCSGWWSVRWGRVAAARAGGLDLLDFFHVKYFCFDCDGRL